jgi:o-succinylbenzoate---CoA ligase
MASLTHITESITQATNATPNHHHNQKPRHAIVEQWIGFWNSNTLGISSTSQKKHGTRDEFRFVIFLINSSIKSLECMLGCFGAGMVVVPLNWRWSLEDMCGALEDMKHAIVGVVVDQHFEELAMNLLSLVCENGTMIVRVSDPIPKRMQPPQLMVEAGLSKAPHNVACVIFTSGTASKPKAAMLTHDNILFQCHQKIVCCGYCESDVYLHMAPLFHVGGLVSALAMVVANARHVFMPTPQFDPHLALERLRENSCTSFIAVPTMLKDLLDANEEYGSGRKFETLKRILVGAGGLDDADTARVQRVMPHATLLTAYGMTEACSSMSYKVIRAGLPRESSGEHVCVGEIPNGIHVGVLNQHGYVHIHGKGELVTRGRHVFHGYYTGKPTYRQSPDFVCDARGNVWFRTGDLGLISGSTLWLTGRVKDMIKTGGENVAAAEVERILMKHSDIVECSVYAIPDARWGQAVAAAVVCRLPRHQHLQESRSLVAPSINGTMYQRMKSHCLKQGLSPYKIPKCLMLSFSPLPRNATGKVIKHELQKTTVEIMNRETQSLTISKL